MPFPLAHPAAVLPLRRYCPSKLNLVGLVVGSVSPDLAYGFGPLGLEGFSHSLAGTFVFCLPLGIVLSWLFGRLGPRLLRFAPDLRLAGFEPPKLWPARDLLVLLVSLLLGAWTHLLWDSVTHEQGWFVMHVSLLRMPLGTFLGHHVRVYHALWYGCSFAGVAWLYVLYERWRRGGGNFAGSAVSTLFRAVLVAMTALLLAAMHHLSHDWLVSLLAGFLGVALVLGLSLALGRVAMDPP